MFRRKQRSPFDQVFEIDRGRIVAYRNCGLSFREIGSRVGRNQTTQSGLSARCPLLGLPMTQSHRRLRPHWCDERRMWVAEWNVNVLLYFQGMATTIFQQDNGRPHVARIVQRFFVRLNCFPGRLALQIFHR
ncbi:transposable element Tcb1 transposase [Trichonephila clavipes]|uniref:Transposable element Tcb1 transposase n=1 Tax=Trichonephila clavipes TaxID=2585209 RepID=A0A8X6W1G7_TRICX|nr:transposable element Tcb1 transposase [Trichonephila clavipes]